jgi:TPR repeat protein
VTEPGLLPQALAVAKTAQHGLGEVRQNYEAAGEWYQKAAEHGSGIGRDNIGRLRTSGHIKD